MPSLHTMIAASVFAAVSPSPPAAASPPAPAQTSTDASGLHDFDFMFGNWRVRHHRLKSAPDEWVEFDGRSSTRPIMGGAGNLEDNVLNPPSGSYRAAAVRAYDAKTGLWAIWWVDGRNPHGVLDPPVSGRFENGIGRFYADYIQNGKPMRVRYTWTHATPDTAHWEQASSADAGKTWETNWKMDFTRDD